MTNLPVPAPRTFTVGETEVGAYLNSVRDCLNFLLNEPIAVLYQGAAQSIPNSAFTAVTFDQSLTDSYGAHSNTTNPSRMVAQVAGFYDLDGGFSLAASNTTGARDGQWYKNGSAISTPGAGVVVGGSASNTCTTPMPGLQVFLGVGDYVELFVFQNSGGAINTNVATFTSYVSIRWVHA